MSAIPKSIDLSDCDGAADDLGRATQALLSASVELGHLAEIGHGGDPEVVASLSSELYWLHLKAITIAKDLSRMSRVWEMRFEND